MHEYIVRESSVNAGGYWSRQAGHGGLYGFDPEEYRAMGCCIDESRYPYIDVNRLAGIYREKVNPKVNVYCIQTAVLYGWTGKELVFADAVMRIWDEIEGRGN